MVGASPNQSDPLKNRLVPSLKLGSLHANASSHVGIKAESRQHDSRDAQPLRGNDPGETD